MCMRVSESWGAIGDGRKKRASATLKLTNKGERGKSFD